MYEKLNQIFAFPDEFPPISAGLLFLDQGIIITGHYNGYVVKWEIDSKKHEILHDCGDKVETLSKSPTNQILVGCNSGYLFYFDLTNPKEKIIIQVGTDATSSRIWRSVWPTDNTLLTTSTYGGLNLFNKTDLKWDNEILSGHYHSIFGITNKNGKYLISGDYKGKIIIWEKHNDGYKSIDELKIQGSVEDISWIKEDSFSAIDDLGHINIFELDSISGTWKPVVGADVATSGGQCIHAIEDGKTVFAGSNTELIQFDLDSQQIQTINLEKIRKIFSKNNQIYVLTALGLFSFERSQIQVPLELVKYQYAKVSLIGHTGVGKSTLCSSIITGSTDNVKATFGKKIWTWELPNNNNGPEKRIIFHDHGGQETVLTTFLPFLSDSNIILVFFKQTDKTTLEKAYEIINDLKSIVTPKSKIYLVQTHIDEDVIDIDENQITRLIELGEIVNCFKISPKTGEGVQEFLEQLKIEIDWSSSQTMAQSEYVEGLMKTITDLSLSDATVVSFNSLKSHFQEKTSLNIPTSHLNFLLTNFSSQGFIEYYPEVLKSVIFNHDEYNKLRSNVPILVDQKKGIISMKEIEKIFKPSTYLQILDNVFLKYSIAIKDKNLRIFPGKLKPEGITIKEPYESFLKSLSHQHEYVFPFQKIKLYNLISALIELKLKCIDASKFDGLFVWETNACLYFSIGVAGNSITGRNTKISYFIGGKDNKICDRLNKEFSSIIMRLFGPTVSQDTQTSKPS